MLNPIATYRIQFHKEFTFKDFEQIIPYLHELGITTIYASPILEAAPGSMHGYDTINPQRINPEIGTLDELRAISRKLQELNMFWIQDIVPNHMSFHPGNIWLMDVLEKGEQSEFAAFFDINWSGDKHQPLMVPFLGSSLDDALAAAELKLVQRDSGIKLKYFDTEWPVNAQVKSVDMPLKQALKLQYYRPCSWKETDTQINYRRFFTVNSLICLNMQHEETFTAYHQLIRELLEEGIFQGLRVDHVDGLYDPDGYLDRLRELAGEDTYLIVEKIQEEGENLPGHWPVEGTTGYDFLAQVNNLFTARHAEKKFSKYYEHLTGEDKSIERLIRQKKAGILAEHMAGELDNLYHLFLELQLATEKELNSLKPGTLKDAIGQLLICCPVYRFYGAELPLPAEYYKELSKLLKEIKVVKVLGDAVDLLKKVLLVRPYDGDLDYNEKATRFYLRCMQFSGPLMAKGVEDTLMYTYNRFIGHNEVGDAPAAFGSGKKEFHRLMNERAFLLPASLNGTSTHDTKRGEDVRARLNILTDVPEAWFAAVESWRTLNAELAHGLDPNDEYFIYQTLAGSYPMPDMPADDYPQRLQDYLVKALREGKVNSGWAEPDTTYEELVKDFVNGILDQSAEFWKSFSGFHRSLSNAGVLNSLSQLLLKFTCPGVPDTYQGTELWDLSLVDPDNRRPVDYEQRREWLKELDEKAPDLASLWAERFNGKIKLYLLHHLLKKLKPYAELLSSGEYLPLKVKGEGAKHFLSFARQHGDQFLVVIIPLHFAQEQPALKDLEIELPEDGLFRWNNLIRDEEGVLEEPLLHINDFADPHVPLGLIVFEKIVRERGAGILLPLTSLPSPYGIGDMGAEARLFIEFLADAGQKYWQLLPLNPVTAEQAFSPYSSVSAMAGNTLLISMEDAGMIWLLPHDYLKKHRAAVKDEVDFEKVVILKNKMLAKAYNAWMAGARDESGRFENFCLQEKEWLDDFALYSVLKENLGNAPWMDWEPVYRDRDAVQLAKFAAAHEEELRFVKWKQYIFFEQWASLKAYAAYCGIKLYGDLPFYVAWDSADVWSHRNLFDLDAEGKMTGIAGVPPDYFNAEGQLWGMPVYNWERMKADDYQWWIRRIRKNMEMYDLLRLDHFRAFYDYWEVPAGEITAVNGTWKPGPGSAFFHLLKAEFPDLPFIAEDLGEISEGVYALRDEFRLPGMKVLQFAFGNDIEVSDHIPHNYRSDNFVVYTGTHDNDTSRGWYELEAKGLRQQNLDNYTGTKVTAKNVHTVLSRMAYASVARIAILPMQDVLGLDAESRMNTPAGMSSKNWRWRMKKIPGSQTGNQLKVLVKLYGRR